MKSNVLIFTACCFLLSACNQQAERTQAPFPYTVTEETKNRELSEAMQRSFYQYSGIHPAENELYTQFKYTRLEGLDYNNSDGTISRRDPSKIIFENGKYYVWYTYRHTPTVPMGPDLCNDTIPSTDWDLCEIWYATSEDGFTWEEQGVAVPRPPKPQVGWRSVSTTDILKWKGKYYLYYQGFMEASGKRGDYCPVALSSADSPDGPWTASHEIVIPNGPEGSWDQYAIHDPYPLVHDGKIYLYYKSAFNRPGNVWVAGGLAIAEDPLGPFEKHPLNPVLNSGHEVSLFPFKEGVAAIMVKDGNEHFTINYAKDWVNFQVASYCELVPIAPGAYIPDAFTSTDNGQGITWGLSHFTNAGKKGINQHSILARFDCDLSQEIHDPAMKTTGTWHNLDVYFNQGLSKEQRERIDKQNHTLRKVLVPKQANEFVWVYKPAGDYFFGPDTKYLKEGEWYDEWVANDHTFVKAEDGRWHIFGITHPLVESDPLQAGIHDGEYASFHALSSATSFMETLKEHHYSDLPKVLPPNERPGEVLANHAPYIVKKEELYHMVYGHSPIRLAVSSDLSEWEPKGNLFTEADGARNAEQLFGDARDPNLLFHDGIYYILYCSTKSVNLRESKDLIHWSEPTTILKTETFDPESPSLIFHNNTFYLFVCSWDGIWDQKEIVGAYQHKTYVLQSDNPLDFGTDHEKQVALLNAHAPEIFQDEDGQWYISSVEWPNRGVSVDKLSWE